MSEVEFVLTGTLALVILVAFCIWIGNFGRMVIKNVRMMKSAVIIVAIDKDDPRIQEAMDHIQKEKEKIEP